VQNIPNVNVEALIGHSSPIAGIAHCNLSLHKELDLISECLIQGEDIDVPFTLYQTKKQKRQLNKLNFYNTRSKGGLATPFLFFFLFFFSFFLCFLKV